MTVLSAVSRGLRRLSRLVRRVWLSPVRFYQRAISPLLPASCRYSPSCSQYAIEAVEQRGVIRGSLLAGWRIVRCNPLCTGGHDPVPLPASRAMGPFEGKEGVS